MTASAASSAMGALVRKLRVQRGLRLEDLARRSGYTKGFLSKIENGRASPPIATLMRVAQALSVDPGIFFQKGEGSGNGDPHATVHVPAKKRARLENKGAGYDYFALAAPRMHKAMEPFLITVRPEDADFKQRFQHPGEEFIFVVAGETDYVVGDETFRLRKGDSLYFESTRPHAPLPKDGPVTFLAIFYAPPRPQARARTRKRS